MESVAYLTNIGPYTKFTFGGQSITFLTSKNLERYTQIKEWDNGYIVVMARNVGKPEHEDYIDLLPILENLYMDADSFLKNIKEVRLDYANS